MPQDLRERPTSAEPTPAVQPTTSVKAPGVSQSGTAPTLLDVVTLLADKADGGGISGLAAAISFQEYKGGRALVIDNHPIFGGEAQRNEFLVDGRRLTAHQGSAIFLVPKKGGYPINCTT